MSLACRVVPSPPPPKAYLTGAIDERADLQATFDQLTTLPEGPLVVNLEGILRINSIGLRKWIPLLAALSKSRKLVVEALSYPMVLQANSIANLLPDVRVVSCIAPYYCSLCEATRSTLVRTEEVLAAQLVPAKACPDCNSPMEFDELDEYFNFLRRHL
jgi:hypothetical protein